MHFSLVLSGTESKTVHSHTEFAGAFSVVRKDAGGVHANDFGASGARFARLILRDGTLGALLDDAASRNAPPRWLEDGVEQWRAEWEPETTVAAVAHRVGVHPVYLARCMRRWYGVSVGDELRRLRLSAAVAVLSDVSQTVSRTAHLVGYADEAHLNRALRAAVGLTPGRYRQLLGSLPLRLPEVSGHTEAIQTFVTP